MTAKRLITVRRATQADETDIRALQDASLRILGAADYAPEEIASLIGSIGTLDTRALADGTCFVAIVEGEIVASGAWTSGPAPFDPYIRAGGTAEAGRPVILGVFVDPVYASSGLAQRILGALEDDIARLGHAHAEVATIYGAMPFYSAAGYRPCRLMTLALPDGVEINGVRMAKSLPSTMALAA